MQIMTDSAFQAMIADSLRQTDPEILTQTIPEAELPLYSFIEKHAQGKQLKNTAIALPLVSYLMRANSAHRSNFRHAMSACWMLIDLHIPLDEGEEDILLAATLCHVLPEVMRYPDWEQELVSRDQLSAEICQVVKLTFREDGLTDAQEQDYFARIRENKLALLTKLADRSNLVEQLHSISSLNARIYIYETRSIYMPMCIYAKSHYPAMLGPINVMAEKMHSLIEVAEILLRRYESRETELVNEILSLQEDNANLTGMIRALQSEQ